MPGRRARPFFRPGDDLPPLPIDETVWNALMDELGLPPQQRRAVELLHRRLRYKEIAAVMGISARTVRDHLDGVEERLGVGDCVEIILELFERSHSLKLCERCRQARPK